MEHTERELHRIISGIKQLDGEALKAAMHRQSILAKPPESLGKLEDISIQIAGITGKVINKIEKKRLIVMAADNGVIEEGVSVSPQSVTLAQTVNLTKGITGASSIARHFGCEVCVYDVGVNAVIDCPDVINRKIAMGTRNLYREPAMTRSQAVSAVMTGIEAARDAHDAGIDIIGVGEMGIGNTTTSSAILSVLTGLPAEETTGRGGGITDESFNKKKRVIDGALALHKPDKNDILDVLSKVGGFDIAAMTGVFLGAAYYRIPVVIDGLISIVAALCAARLCRTAAYYMIPSHASYEKGYSIAAKELSLSPYLLLNMRLGEGSGCPISFEIVSAACAMMANMATFDGAEINDDYLEEIRANDRFKA